ncbi:plasmid replication protein RepC [Aliiroseovarius sp. KMU-50]|uniref:Plasmid replication protein RepC n=1 Tax=Aliiroseovarius salicola TaxID=3009082 RepID=A0ABT4W517_9RHOB|nr:plasmid replication protein RepC [Aliiroseovarius sp. KMU-50]MDA5095609.1 plasmid replication protein RepC [Aliiroseovarius sp. KMU-50]
MNYTPVTPFRRMVEAAHLQHQVHAGAELPPNGVNKWEALRELSAGRTAFGLSDRDMTVLQALVSFHQATILGGNDSDLVVHPSNRSICERLNGMPCSTMRRHLAHLVAAGVIIRRDSPNGKRYARRYGDDKVAFGFDLTPLATRFQEFCGAAEAIRAAEGRLKRLREMVSLMRRDLAGLAEYGAETRPDLPFWDACSDLARLTARALRRKLSIEDLGALEADLKAALDDARTALDPSVTEDMSTNDVTSEQHIQNSNKDSYDSELHLEKAKAAAGDLTKLTEACDEVGDENEEPEDKHKLPNVPLGLVLASCPEIQTYSDGAIRHWHELVRAADVVRPMMGISPSAWDEARREMGPEEAAVVVAAMLERFADIRSPGGYLRNLSSKAALGAFSCGPMVMALMRKDAA